MSQLFIETPLIESFHMSKVAQTRVFMKMDALQPTGSFKDRGIGHLCKILKEKGATDLVSSSGGNAGHAVSNAGRVLGMNVTVIVPTTTKQVMIDRMRARGATVEVHGENWNAADVRAREIQASGPHAEYVHPFDNPLLWDGHSTLVDEIARSWTVEEKPGAIVVAVGGGGLLCGVFLGLKRAGWDDVAVITAETEGAASFAKAYEKGELVLLPSIDSIATSLGARQVAADSLRMAQEHQGAVLPQVVSDAEAVEACVRYSNDQRVLVEPACGAALAVVYSEKRRGVLSAYKSVVVVVCGGTAVTHGALVALEKEYCA